MDRYDLGEFAGLGLIITFAGLIWLPAVLLAGGIALLVETNLRSRGRAPVRGARPLARVGKAVRAARVAWSVGDDAAA